MASAVATWSHCISRGPASAEPGVVSWFQAVREGEYAGEDVVEHGDALDSNPVLDAAVRLLEHLARSCGLRRLQGDAAGVERPALPQHPEAQLTRASLLS